MGEKFVRLNTFNIEDRIKENLSNYL